MDPITLSILFGSAALAGAGITRAMNEPEPGDMVIRKVFNTSDGWMTTELLSPYTLDLTGQILDMNLNGLWPKIESGFFRVMVLALPGGDLKKQVLLVLQSAGQYGWFLSEAYCPGYRRVQGRLAYQRIEALLGFLNTDPADVVVNHAMSLADLNARYDYLKFAISANPQLAALLSMSDDFKTITRETVKVVDPATYARVETQRRGQESRLGVQSRFRTLDRSGRSIGSPSPLSESWSYQKGDRVMLMGAYGPGGLVYAETSSEHRPGTVLEVIADLVRVAPDDGDPNRSAMWPKALVRPLSDHEEEQSLGRREGQRAGQRVLQDHEGWEEQSLGSPAEVRDWAERTRREGQRAGQRVLQDHEGWEEQSLGSPAEVRDWAERTRREGLDHEMASDDDLRSKLLVDQVLRAVNQIPEPRAQLQYLEQIYQKYPGASRASPELRARRNELEAMVHPERALIPEGLG